VESEELRVGSVECGVRKYSEIRIVDCGVGRTVPTWDRVKHLSACKTGTYVKWGVHTLHMSHIYGGRV